jgi:hypothetical protein
MAIVENFTIDFLFLLAAHPTKNSNKRRKFGWERKDKKHTKKNRNINNGKLWEREEMCVGNVANIDFPKKNCEE